MAMAMVIGAGMATTAGSLFVFCTNSTNKKILAAALGASAGKYVDLSDLNTATNLCCDCRWNTFTSDRCAPFIQVLCCTFHSLRYLRQKL